MPTMLDSVLDVAFGITFFFALLALVASSIQEIIAAVLSTRGKVLQQMLIQILADAPVQTAPPAAPSQVADLAARVIAHPLISGVATANLPAWLSRRLNSVQLPSYVPSGNFATALIETLRAGHDETLAVGSQISRAIALLPETSPVKRVLQGFAVETKGDLDALRARIQLWYDDAMDRASGVYKRFAQYMLLVIGLGLALAINADVISIADTLWHDKTARDVVATAAQQYIDSHPELTSALKVPPPATGKAQPADAAKAEAARAAADDAKAAADAALAQIRDAGGIVNKLPVPLGWTSPPHDSSILWWLMSKVLGILLTAFAVSLGAPFWFDMLQNIANLRGAGPKPARSDATS
jgi:hypothetical protein